MFFFYCFFYKYMYIALQLLTAAAGGTERTVVSHHWLPACSPSSVVRSCDFGVPE
jgi:hypothetical protein